MKLTDFSFELPQGLIAQYPPAERGQSRLMVLDRATGVRAHRMVRDLPELLSPGSLLVFNNSKVRKARLYGSSPETGAAVEFLLLKQLDDRRWLSMVRHSRRRRPGSRYVFADGTEGEITGTEDELRILCFDRPLDEEWFDRYGHIPLPPYIRRKDTREDGDRYQTVYAEKPGSAAAPTAGLHFTRELMTELARRGVETAFITLHVGLGTFLPVRTENPEDHRMHEEAFTVDEEAARRIETAKAQNRKIIAVGTTSVRTLESAWTGEGLRRGAGSTAIFIYPGYAFKVVDALFTNFHTPESTLLMLVSAFAGREYILESYREAVRRDYRFFSYGDAMLIQ